MPAQIVGKQGCCGAGAGCALKKPQAQNISPPVGCEAEWHVLLDANSKRHRLRFAKGVWCNDTAQIMTAEQAYRLAWLYVGPARG